VSDSATPGQLIDRELIDQIRKIEQATGRKDVLSGFVTKLENTLGGFGTAFTEQVARGDNAGAVQPSIYGPVPGTVGNVLGVLSLIIYSLVLVISIKYIAIVMRADNQGEGGILALTALLPQREGGGPRWPVLVLMGIFGASLLYGLEARDPSTFALAAVVLALTAAVAGWLPARRATRVDPATVLRNA